MSDFGFLLVEINESLCAAGAYLLDRHPAMRARIRTARINRTAETSADECFWFVSVFHC
jgi:hypothetical protein